MPRPTPLTPSHIPTHKHTDTHARTPTHSESAPKLVLDACELALHCGHVLRDQPLQVRRAVCLGREQRALTLALPQRREDLCA
jgi:hypothetical protein